MPPQEIPSPSNRRWCSCAMRTIGILRDARYLSPAPTTYMLCRLELRNGTTKRVRMKSPTVASVRYAARRPVQLKNRCKWRLSPSPSQTTRDQVSMGSQAQ